MRIVIDLQDGDLPEPVLTRCKAIITTAGEHQVWLACAVQGFQPKAVKVNNVSSMDKITETFADFLPLNRIVAYQTIQSSNPSAWFSQCANSIRVNFLRSLHADLVFLPVTESTTQTTLNHYVETQQGLLVWTEICCPEQTPSSGQANNQSSLEQAQTLWRAFEAVQQSASAGQIQTSRQRLAYISPMPPEKSGIADYSAQLIPLLARYYEIDLILDQPDLVQFECDAGQEADYSVHSCAWFEEHAHQYQRILYHFGNSPAHRHMFSLLEKYPGIEVLHDFYLANILHYLDHTGYQKDALLQALYASHGLTGIADLEKNGLTAAVWKYPCNKTILDQATGVIVHSEFPKQLARHWYAAEIADQWQVIPLLRTAQLADRQQARAQLGLAVQDFLVCCFGMLGPTKLNSIVLQAWLDSSLAADQHCQLVFVGENPDTGVDLAADQFAAMMAQHGSSSKIHITGYVAPDEYANYLAAADCAVQLRSMSRGETSAALLDCLMNGLPVIVNQHGSSAEIPDDVVYKLSTGQAGLEAETKSEPVEDEPAKDDTASLSATSSTQLTAELSTALNILRNNQTARDAISRKALDYMAKVHASEKIAQAYYEAIEEFTASSPKQHSHTIMQAIALQNDPAPEPDELLQLARLLSASQPYAGQRQLLIDISAVVKLDLKTGIQRVVRSILSALILDPPAGFRIEPVYSLEHSNTYCYARKFIREDLQLSMPLLEDDPVELHRGDIFLALDFSMGTICQNQALFRHYKNSGVQLYFLVYDLLPLLRPGFFPVELCISFNQWLAAISSVADGLICISNAVAADLQQWMSKQPARLAVSNSDVDVNLKPAGAQCRIDSFRLGADFDVKASRAVASISAPDKLPALRTPINFLMVGTIEPRKGYEQALSAFEQLWSEGLEISLIIVGKQGWRVDDLAAQLRQHRQNGKQLFWLEDASDDMLAHLYRHASALLLSSEGEGFGLPLVEAANYGLPVIARNLPVFQEVAGQHVYYFEGYSEQALPDALRTWIDLYQSAQVPQSAGMPRLSWQESASELMAVILKEQ